MKVMKKITTILSMSACLLVFTSCQDWLDMPSESKADSSTILSRWIVLRWQWWGPIIR